MDAKGMSIWKTATDERIDALKDKIPEKYLRLIECAEEARAKERREDVRLLDEWMVTRGFTKSDGTKNRAALAKAADVSASLLSKLCTGSATQKNVRAESLFCIVIALRMPVEDATAFLHHTGCSFALGSRRDMAIKAYVESGYLGNGSAEAAAADAYALLETYSAYVAERESKKTAAGVDPVPQIYRGLPEDDDEEDA